MYKRMLDQRLCRVWAQSNHGHHYRSLLKFLSFQFRSSCLRASEGGIMFAPEVVHAR